MKVAHIVGSLEARYGGPSRSVRHLASATARNGYEVDLLTSAPEALPDEHDGTLTIRTWRRGWPGAFCLVPGMVAHLKDASYDVVHHHGIWLRTLHYARRKAGRDRVPLVVSPRGMMSPWAWRLNRTRKAFAARWLHPGALHAVDGWNATSPEEADDIRRRGFTQPVCIAPNGVDQPDEADLAAASEHWRASVPAIARWRVALFYSRFHHKKRIIELIDLWAATAPEGWMLLIVGVPEEFSVGQLRSYLLRAQGASRIEVCDGSGQPPPYAVASLFLLPSHSENFGLAIAEAMAHGVPVLVTDTTPWSALNREDSGWCVPWQEFGSALRRATNEDAGRLRERGTRARTWVLREFSWARSAELVAAFYATLREVRT